MHCGARYFSRVIVSNVWLEEKRPYIRASSCFLVNFQARGQLPFHSSLKPQTKHLKNLLQNSHPALITRPYLSVLALDCVEILLFRPSKLEKRNLTF